MDELCVEELEDFGDLVCLDVELIDCMGAKVVELIGPTPADVASLQFFCTRFLLDKVAINGDDKGQT